MALTFDTKARIPSTALSTTTSAATGSYTCGTDAEVLAVQIMYAGVTARTGGAPTYNGVALVQVESRRGVTEASCEMWYMLSPPVSQSLKVLVPNDNARTMWVYVASANAAVGYTCAFDSSGVNATTAANPSVALTTLVSGTFIFAVVATGDNTFAPTARTGVSLYEEDIAAYGSAGQYLIKTDVGSQTMSWTEATSDDYGAIAVAFKEVIEGDTYEDALTLSKSLGIVGSVLGTYGHTFSLAKSIFIISISELAGELPPNGFDTAFIGDELVPGFGRTNLNPGTMDYWVGGEVWPWSAVEQVAASGTTYNSAFTLSRSLSSIFSADGSTYQPSLSLSKILDITSTVNATYLSDILLAKSLGITNISSLVYEATITAAKILNLVVQSNITLAETITLGRTEGLVVSDIVTIVEAILLQRSLDVRNTATVQIDELITLARLLDIVTVSALPQLFDTLTLAKQIDLVHQATTTAENSITLSKSNSITTSSLLTALAATTLSKQLDITSALSTVMSESIMLSDVRNIVLSGGLNVESAFALQKILDVLTSSQNTLELSTTLGKQISIDLSDTLNILVSTFLQKNLSITDSATVELSRSEER